MPLKLTYKGFNYVDPYNGAYADSNSLPQVAATGANSVALTPDYGINVAGSSIYAATDATDSLANELKAVHEAAAVGMTAFVRPLIDFYYSQASKSVPGAYYVANYDDPNNVPPGVKPATVPPGAVTTSYRGFLQPADLNLPAFFKSYGDMIVTQAQQAQAAGVKLFSIGTELDTLADDTDPAVKADWSNLISRVRTVYTGKLTYGSNWASADKVTFWNKLDVVGIDGYVPLSNTVPGSASQNPSLTELVDGWTKPSDVVVGNTTVGKILGGLSAVDAYDKIAQQSIDKQYVFTEIGYPNDTNAAQDPDGNTETGVADPALQSRLYEAFFDAFGQQQQIAAAHGGLVDGQPFSLAGAYFWNWYPDSVTPSGDEFALDHAQASAVIAQGFAGTLVDASVCYVTGTRIRTTRGDVAVEALAVGDLVVTASGAERPIRWLGHREVDCAAHPDPRSVWPIRVAAHAFGDGLPSTDLFLSKGHSVRVGTMGDVLIPIGKLINGATISRHPVAATTYWHVELDSHDVLIANDLPAESFLDCGNRAGLVEQAGRHDGCEGPHTPADFCLPYVDSGEIVDAVRALLAARAARLGWTTTCDLDLHLVVDGVRVRPDIDGDLARFIFPAAAEHVVLASATHVPSDNADVLDHRRLGVSVLGLEIDDGLCGRTWFALDDERLAGGWHPEEAAAGLVHRFANGPLPLPRSLWTGCRSQVVLRVHHDPASGTRGRRSGQPPAQALAGEA